ncbi:unnamed protein product [Ceratitis capitata]|uniref:(Mediterranean fruit fly) hypothetical protein n=1 Tax=Ceratitis capitata TaxID=7213 RepID=A0A811UQL7_CERCA|nr:unnamed protein product [Ceratitis capitata]
MLCTIVAAAAAAVAAAATHTRSNNYVATGHSTKVVNTTYSHAWVTDLIPGNFSTTSSAFLT